MALSPVKTPAYEVSNWLQYGNGTGAVGPEGGPKVGMYANHGKYTLYDNRTGKVLAEGSTPEELKNISDIISGTLVPQGNDADWRLYSTNPVVQTRPHREFLGGGEGPLKLDGNPFGDIIQGYDDLSAPGDPRGRVIAGDMPNNFFKDMLLPMAMPILQGALAYFGPGLLGSAFGKGTSGLSAITPSSATNAALSSLANVPIATGLPAASLAGTTLGAGALSSAAPGITVLGNLAPVGLTGAQAATLGANLLSGAGLTSGGFGSAGSSTGADTGSSTGAGSVDPLTNEIVVSGTKVPPIDTTISIPSVTLPSLGTPSVSASNTQGPNDAVDNNPIEVKGQPGKVPPTEVPPITVPMTLPAINVPKVPTDLGTPDIPKAGKPTSTIDKIIDYTQLAGLLSGTLGNLFGGGGGSGGGKYLGSGNRSPIFSAKLPDPSLPGGVKTMTARTMPEQNWYEYGFHPGQSFFNTSAPGYTPQPGKTPGMARGGDFAVRGPGDGRSDSIPARLSDGEYVMDAETVALLGNGSPKAGAERLDAFRVSIRKHKGRNLAQGKFSVKAKRPEAYLAGGRA